MFDRDTIQALRSACLAALNGFVNEAHKTCQGFDGIEDVSALSNERMMDLLDQRLAENDAFERYQDTRRRLFAVARNGKEGRSMSS